MFLDNPLQAKQLNNSTQLSGRTHFQNNLCGTSLDFLCVLPFSGSSRPRAATRNNTNKKGEKHRRFTLPPPGRVKRARAPLREALLKTSSVEPCKLPPVFFHKLSLQRTLTANLWRTHQIAFRTHLELIQNSVETHLELMENSFRTHLCRIHFGTHSELIQALFGRHSEPFGLHPELSENSLQKSCRTRSELI